ncbi:PH domain-containing protein [uncultured Serinicoccus sp.]|uniref:PH domain-containing protein n=2 Tax=uncultured Serinicoccus sp. TaxID=735514 RepID=UPI002619E372|nr:hypothetical protein [uncultured Serinicoccus sp.]
MWDRFRWLWLAMAVAWLVIGVLYLTVGEWPWVAMAVVWSGLGVVGFVSGSRGTAADRDGLSLHTVGRKRVPWDEVVGFRLSGRDLQLLTVRLVDGSELLLTVPGNQLDELLGYAPSRLSEVEVLRGSRDVRRALDGEARS